MPTARQKQLRRRARHRPLDIEQRLKLWLSGPRRLLWLIAHERRANRWLSATNRWRALRKGFAPTSYLLYELDRNDPSLYVRDYVHQTYALLERHRATVREKLSFSLMMRAIGAPHPATLALLREGRLLDLVAPHGHLTTGDLLERSPRLVFRPIAGWGGVGVFFVSKSDSGLAIDGHPTSAADLEGRLASLDEYLVTEFLDQADYARAIFPDTPNTIRLLTLWDIDRDRPFVAAAAHRFGNRRSGAIDNFHQGLGGVSAPIDLETGRMGSAVGLDPKGRRVTFDRHLDTAEPIVGVEIPRWRQTLDMALRIAAALPHCPLVGWDVLMTNTGARWLEANSAPGLPVWQVHGPLLADPRARRFFEWLG